MKCPKCNITDNAHDANFCHMCGAKLNNSSASYFNIRKKIREISLNPERKHNYNYKEILEKVKEIYNNERILNNAWGCYEHFYWGVDDECLHYIAEWILDFKNLDKEVKSLNKWQLKEKLKGDIHS